MNDNQKDLQKSRIYVDFNEMIDYNLVLLSQKDFKVNSNGEEIEMIESQKIDIYMDDQNVDGSNDSLIASGIIEKNNSGICEVAKWVCRIDDNGIQNESDLLKSINSEISRVLNFRKATISDLKEMQQLYIETIQWVCKNDYNPDQIDAWTAGVHNTERWIEVIESQFVLLAIIENKMVGFGTLKDGNYIDFFYIHKDFQRKGIADKILSKLELEAKKQFSKIITSDISITAKPFFEKKGFAAKAEQKNIRLGIELINYKMQKELK